MVWDGERWALDVQESEFMRGWVGGGGGGVLAPSWGVGGGDGSIMGGGGWLHHVEGGLRNSPQEITMVLLQKKKNLVS